MPDGVWNDLLSRVRGEFDEMPCLRVTPDQARTLFGLQEPTVQWVLDRLVSDGFLSRTDQGEYVRRQAAP
jgi:hypothetical protein